MIAIAIGSGGCVRDPAPAICPEVVIGDLAVSEIRRQSSDTQGSWIELYNASGHELDLRGLELRFRGLDGTDPSAIFVRRSIILSAGDYAVLGLVTDDDVMRPNHVDYGFAADFDTDWPSAAAIDVNACDVLIDRVMFSSLPSMGTYSLGTMPPSANSNDFELMWCTDGTMSAGSYPGTPQQPNLACPVI